jgi:hypothetical protein
MKQYSQDVSAKKSKTIHDFKSDDLISFEKQKLAYYATVFEENEQSNHFPFISLCHRTAVGSSQTMQDCWYNLNTICIILPSNHHKDQRIFRITPIRDINPYMRKLAIRAQVLFKSKKFDYTRGKGQMFFLHLSDPADQVTLFVFTGKLQQRIILLSVTSGIPNTMTTLKLAAITPLKTTILL